MALLCSTICPSFPLVTIHSRNVVCFTPIAKQKCFLKLSFFRSISTGFRSVIPVITNPPQKQSPSSLTVFAAKGYKRKTHKASAKRFRVTGTGKIIRRRAGKQHLLAKKNTKRKLRLSKLIQVNRSDYDNVIGALPYLKVKRQAKKVIPSETKTEIS